LVILATFYSTRTYIYTATYEHSVKTVIMPLHLVQSEFIFQQIICQRTRQTCLLFHKIL